MNKHRISSQAMGLVHGSLVVALLTCLILPGPGLAQEETALAAPPATGEYVIPSFDHIDDIETLHEAASQAQRAAQGIAQARSGAAKTPEQVSAAYEEYTKKALEIRQAHEQRYEQLLAREDNRRAAAPATAAAPAAAGSVDPGSAIAERILQSTGIARANSGTAASPDSPQPSGAAAGTRADAGQDAGPSFDHIDTLDALDQAAGQAQLDARNEYENQMKAGTLPPPGQGDLSSQLAQIEEAYEQRRRQLLALAGSSPSATDEQSTEERLRLAMEGELQRINASTARRQPPEPGSAEMAAIEALPPSERVRAFGYEDYRYLGSVAERDYFMLPASFDNHVRAEGHDPFAPPASFDGSLNVAIVHDLGENDHILDLDIFPFQDARPDYWLGYRLADAEVARFNRDLESALNAMRQQSPGVRRVSVHHHLKSKPLPQPLGSDIATSHPVFLARWKLGADGSWEPGYRYGDVDHFQYDGYSYASALREIRLFDEERTTGRHIGRSWAEEADEAYRHASAAAKARRPQIAHWTAGYWALARDELGRNLLEGHFDRVPHDGDFDSFFTSYVEWYGWRCAEFISPAVRFENTTTWRERREYGYIEEWVDRKETYEATMEPRFLETFQRIFERDARPGGPSNLSASLARQAAITRLIRSDGCQSSNVRRLADNLYRHAQSDAGN